MLISYPFFVGSALLTKHGIKKEKIQNCTEQKQKRANTHTLKKKSEVTQLLLTEPKLTHTPVLLTS